MSDYKIIEKIMIPKDECLAVDFADHIGTRQNKLALPTKLMCTNRCKLAAVVWITISLTLGKTCLPKWTMVAWVD